jgi:hypothetical protein
MSDLPACKIMPQPAMLPCAPVTLMYYELCMVSNNTDISRFYSHFCNVAFHLCLLIIQVFTITQAFILKPIVFLSSLHVLIRTYHQWLRHTEKLTGLA